MPFSEKTLKDYENFVENKEDKLKQIHIPHDIEKRLRYLAVKEEVSLSSLITNILIWYALKEMPVI